MALPVKQGVHCGGGGEGGGDGWDVGDFICFQEKKSNSIQNIQ